MLEHSKCSTNCSLLNSCYYYSAFSDVIFLYSHILTFLVYLCVETSLYPFDHFHNILWPLLQFSSTISE